MSITYEQRRILHENLKQLVHATVEIQDDVVRILDRSNKGKDAQWRSYASNEDIINELSTRAVLVPLKQINTADNELVMEMGITYYIR